MPSAGSVQVAVVDEDVEYFRASDNCIIVLSSCHPSIRQYFKSAVHFQVYHYGAVLYYIAVLCVSVRVCVYVCERTGV